LVSKAKLKLQTNHRFKLLLRFWKLTKCSKNGVCKITNLKPLPLNYTLLVMLLKVLSVPSTELCNPYAALTGVWNTDFTCFYSVNLMITSTGNKRWTRRARSARGSGEFLLINSLIWWWINIRTCGQNLYTSTKLKWKNL